VDSGTSCMRKHRQCNGAGPGSPHPQRLSNPDHTGPAIHSHLCDRSEHPVSTSCEPRVSAMWAQARSPAPPSGPQHATTSSDLGGISQMVLSQHLPICLASVPTTLPGAGRRCVGGDYWLLFPSLFARKMLNKCSSQYWVAPPRICSVEKSKVGDLEHTRPPGSEESAS
jgi:hypothetical protein